MAGAAWDALQTQSPYGPALLVPMVLIVLAAVATAFSKAAGTHATIEVLSEQEAVA